MKQKKHNKKSLIKIFTIFVSICFMVFSSILFCGCENQTIYVTSIEKTASVDNVDTYLISYSNGTTSTFTITNGENGKDISINEIYEEYVERYGDITYADFLREYLNLSTNDNSMVINSCLQSSIKIYTQFYVTSFLGYDRFLNPIYTNSTSIMCGSGVIYKIEDDYTYILTNYHVVYSSSVNEDNGSNIANKIVGYLYGSENSPIASGTKQNGYEVYDYGEYGTELIYVGGSIDYDIALLKVDTNQIKAINDGIKEVEFANNYYVGETAIAIGNPENEGISATQGIISVDNEYIALSIDDTLRNYRSIRIDTSIYGGSSGGGLFNSYGELIGITNAGDSDDENINYAIPVSIVKNVADNIMYYYDGSNPTEVHQVSLGIEFGSANAKYVYDEDLGYGNIVEDIKVESVEDSSIADNLNLQANDTIKALYINGTEYTFDRYFEIEDILLTLRANDEIKIIYQRNNGIYTTIAYTILENDV